MYVEIMAHVPMQTEDGQTQLVAKTFHLNWDEVLFVFKPHLNPGRLLMTRDIKLQTQSQMPLETLVSFDTPDGTVYLNPKGVIFYQPTDQIGLYVVGLPNGVQFVVKTTEKDLKRGLTGEGNIIL